MLESYNSLESKLGSGKETPEEAPTAETDESVEEAKEAVENAGLDFSTYEQEFIEKGELSDESFKQLEEKGLSRDTVEAFIEGQKALASIARTEAQGIVGGEENYSKMVQWAAANLDEGEIEAFDKAVESPNKAAVQAAIRDLDVRYKAAMGESPTLINGGDTPVNEGYRSIAEMQRDMSDPRYKTDPAFRQDVEDKLAVSSIL